MARLSTSYFMAEVFVPCREWAIRPSPQPSTGQCLTAHWPFGQWLQYLSAHSDDRLI